jgi:hypothetical protein
LEEECPCIAGTGKTRRDVLNFILPLNVEGIDEKFFEVHSASFTEMFFSKEIMVRI